MGTHVCGNVENVVGDEFIAIAQIDLDMHSGVISRGRVCICKTDFRKYWVRYRYVTQYRLTPDEKRKYLWPYLTQGLRVGIWNI